MRLQRLELQNIGPHESADIAFQTGLVGLFGPQGSGKSTLVSAIYAALLNDFSRFLGGQSGAVRQNSGDAPAFVRLTAEQNGVNFVVERRLRPKTSHKLWLSSEPSGKPLTKDSEIREALEGLLGGGRNLLDSYVFVPQWQLRRLFEMTPASRAQSLSQLCGTGWAETCWQSLGRAIELDRPSSLPPSGSLTDLEAAVAAELTDFDACLGRQQDCQSRLLDAEARAAAAAILAGEQDYRVYVAERDRLVARLSAAQADLAALQLQSEQAVAEVASARAAEAAAEAPAKKARAALADLQRADSEAKKRREAVASLSAADKKLASLEADRPSLSMDPVREEELRQRLAEIAAELASVSGLACLSHESLASEFCPTCGQSLEGALAAIQEAKAAADRLNEEQSSLKQELRETSAVRLAWASFEKKLAPAVKERDAAAAVVASLPDVPASSPLELQAAKQAVSRFESAGKEKQRAELTQVRAESQASAKADELEKIQEDLAGLREVSRASAGDIADARRRLAEHQEASAGLRVAEAEATAIRRRLAEAEQRVAAWRKAAAAAESAERWLGLLEQARAVLHRDCLPKLVHAAALRKMEGSVNRLLQAFESPFRVSSSENDLSYTASFRNGTVMPDCGLSGGQQVILSLAVRWALNELFAGQIGLLALDEPTAGLDSRHLSLFEAALAGLGRAARSHGFQVILITHERFSEELFDQVIQLERLVA